MEQKHILIIVLFLLLLSGGSYLYMTNPTGENQQNQQENTGKEEPKDSASMQPSGMESASPSPSGSTSKAPPQPPSSSTPPPVSPPSTTQQKGTVILTITDDAIPLDDNISSLLITLSGFSARKANGQWISISNAQYAYDLLQLKNEGKLELVREVLVPADTYDLLTFVISSAVLTKNGIAHSAKLPSQTIYLPLSLPLRPNQTAAISLDFLADKSIHISNMGQHIFAPVVRIDVLGEIQHVQKSGSKVEFFGGLPKFAGSYGMDETGTMRKNSLGIDSLSHIELVDDIFVLIPFSINRSIFSITPADAIDKTVNGGYLTRVTAVYAEILDKKPVWRIPGTASNGNTVTVYVNAETGAVDKVQ